MGSLLLSHKGNSPHPIKQLSTFRLCIHLAQGTHSDWRCRRCQWPWDLPSQSGSRRRTQGGRARGNPAPGRSTRLPPGSGGRVGVRPGAGRGCNPGHPQSFSPNPSQWGQKAQHFSRRAASRANHLLHVGSPTLSGEDGGCQANSAHCRGAVTGSARKSLWLHWAHGSCPAKEELLLGSCETLHIHTVLELVREGHVLEGSIGLVKEAGVWSQYTVPGWFTPMTPPQYC